MKNNKDLYLWFFLLVALVSILLMTLAISVASRPFYRDCNDYTKYDYDKGYVPVRCAEWNK